MSDNPQAPTSLAPRLTVGSTKESSPEIKQGSSPDSKQESASEPEASTSIFPIYSTKTLKREDPPILKPCDEDIPGVDELHTDIIALASDKISEVDSWPDFRLIAAYRDQHKVLQLQGNQPDRTVRYVCAEVVLKEIQGPWETCFAKMKDHLSQQPSKPRVTNLTDELN